MATKNTNISHSKALQNLPKLEFLVRKIPSGNPALETILAFFQAPLTSGSIRRPRGQVSRSNPACHSQPKLIDQWKQNYFFENRFVTVDTQT
jgi:hypothetical protein